MGKRRKKAALPIMLLWSRKDQARFIETAERLAGLVNDLTIVIAEPKRRAEAAAATRAAKLVAIGGANGAAVPIPHGELPGTEYGKDGE